jgi:hypothetical protein
MAQEKDLGRWGGLVELGGFVGKDLASGAVFLRDLEGVCILGFGRVQRQGHDELALNGGVGGEG